MVNYLIFSLLMLLEFLIACKLKFRFTVAKMSIVSGFLLIFCLACSAITF
jgi:hypothetical protein